MKTKVERYGYTAKRSVYKGLNFESNLELKVYKVLEKLPLSIGLHQKIGSLNWKVDFILKSNNPHTQDILSLIKGIDDLDPLSNAAEIYVEAKGVKDKNFISRLEQLDYYNPDLLSRLLIVGSSLDAVAWYSRREQKIKCLPIVPLSVLSAIVRIVS